MSVSDRLVQLNSIKEDIKDALVSKGQVVSDDMTTYASAIDAIKTEPNLQTKSVTPTTSAQTVVADEGYDGLESVSVNAIQTETKNVNHSLKNDQTITPSAGKYISKVTVPRGVGLTLLKQEQGVSVGSTKSLTLTSTLDTPYPTDEGQSMMGTVFIVVIEDDDVCVPISFPFLVVTQENNNNTNVLPENGYKDVLVPSQSMSSNCIDTQVNLSVLTYSVTDEGIGAVTIGVDITTSSGQGEFDYYVYRLDKLMYWS